MRRRLAIPLHGCAVFHRLRGPSGYTPQHQRTLPNSGRSGKTAPAQENGSTLVPRAGVGAGSVDLDAMWLLRLRPRDGDCEFAVDQVRRNGTGIDLGAKCHLVAKSPRDPATLA